jgi:hypothetical protein
MYDSFNPHADQPKVESPSRKSSQAGLETNSNGLNDASSVKTKTSFNDTATGTVISDMNGANANQVAVKDKTVSEEDKLAYLEVSNLKFIYKRNR